MYINTTTLYTASEADIRAANPNTSFPVPFVPPEGYEFVFAAPAVYDPVTQYATEGTPVLTVKGHYEQSWVITDKSAEVIAAEAEVKRIAAIPASVSPRQIRMALTAAGLRESVEGAVLAGDQNLKDWWLFSTAFDRSNPQVNGMGVALGVASEALDDLWTLAATL